jgi:hypothetical protein
VYLIEVGIGIITLMVWLIFKIRPAFRGLKGKKPKKMDIFNIIASQIPIQVEPIKCLDQNIGQADFPI